MTTGTITKPGEALAARIARKTGPNGARTWPDHATCSLIARHAVTLQHLGEAECNGPADTWPSEPIEQRTRRVNRHETWVARRQDQITARLAHLIESLGYRAHFQSDPRGSMVAIIVDPHDSIEDPQKAVWL